MKTKIFILFILLAVISKISFAQLKVSQYGGIGMGIEPRSDIKLLIKGNMILTTYPEIPPPLTRFTEFRFKVGNGSPGCEFGTPTRNIAVWATEVGYNNLFGAHFFSVSDSRLKTNAALIQNGLQTLMQMQPYSYNRRDTIGGAPSLLKEYGFFAQDIAQFLPEITDSAKGGILLIDYQQIIPFLVAAIKEQQSIIDSLKNGGYQKRQVDSNPNMQQSIDSLHRKINEIKNQIAACCNLKQSQLSPVNQNLNSSSTLLQNRPNPFSEKTVIVFNIVENFNSASIMIFDMQGTLKKTIPIFQSGKGQITINGFDLSAGMYLYSLIIDDKEINTKRMILLN